MPNKGGSNEHLKTFLACLTNKFSGPNQLVHIPMLVLHTQSVFYLTSLPKEALNLDQLTVLWLISEHLLKSDSDTMRETDMELGSRESHLFEARKDSAIGAKTFKNDVLILDLGEVGSLVAVANLDS